MTKEKYKNIVCFGEVLWDMLPGGAKPGGAPLNVAVHLKRQNMNPTLISKVGKDKQGMSLISFLNNSGIETDLIQVDENLPTSQVIVKLDKFKNATYEICEPVAWDNIEFDPRVERAAPEADLIVYGSLASRNEATLKTLVKFITKSKATRFLDVNLRPPYISRYLIEKLIQFSDFVKLNDEELIHIADWNGIKGNETEQLNWFSTKFSCPLVCLTRGAKGAALLVQNQIYEHPGYTVKATDTVGAGDSFLASLIAGLSKNISYKDALNYACATGAFVASKDGAVPVYSVSEIEKIIISADN